MKNVFKTITWIFSLVLVVALVSCEKQVELKGTSILDDPAVNHDPDYGCGLYLSFWHENEPEYGSTNDAKTSIFKITPSGSDMIFKAANPVPFDLKFHIAMDSVGLMWLVDEVTGDIYTWVPTDDGTLPTLAIDASDYVDVGNIQFTQLTIADFKYVKYLVGATTKKNAERIFIIDITDPNVPVFVKSIILDGKINIEGGDMAVLPQEPNVLHVFTKSTQYGGANLYKVHMWSEVITPIGSLDPSADYVINGCAYYGAKMFMSKGSDKVPNVSSGLSAYDFGTMALINYTPTGDYPASGLVYGDMASCSPLFDENPMYHSQWIGSTGETKIYKVTPDIGAQEATFTEINPVAFEQRVHIALDDDGMMYLIDENTGDIYYWAPSSLDLTLPAPIISGSIFGNLPKKQFTQLVVAETAQEKYLFVGEMKNDTIYRIDLGTNTIVQKISDDDWDVSGGDLAVTSMEDVIYMFTKSEDADKVTTEKVYMIDLSAGPSISVVANEAAVGEQINGSVYFDGTVFLSKGTNKLETWGIGDPTTDTYTMFNAPRLHYGDLAAKSPVWQSISGW